jgi:CP family cyanate transporter-like MFS transporter
LSSPGQHTSAVGRDRALLLAALILTGLCMRTAVTSVGAVLDSLQSGLHLSSAVASVVTTLPVACFAGIGAVAPRLARRFGAHRLLVASLITMTAGLVTRALVHVGWAFVLLSILALSGGAIANILMPSLVKRHFPDSIGRMTAVYSTALAVGITAAAGLTVPIGSLGDGWRTGLASWALLSALAVVAWLPTLRRDRPERPVSGVRDSVALGRSPLAWTLMLFFAFQSFQAYVAFGWFAKFFHSHGVSDSTSGALVAVLTAVLIPVSLVAPGLTVRHARPLIVALGACALVSYVGMLVAPVGGDWVWMVLAGTGGGMFPVALTLIGLRAREAETTAGLSAFVQTRGYVLAGSGPLLFGVLHGTTGSWVLPMATLIVALGVSVGAGWLAAAPRYVDDEVATV